MASIRIAAGSLKGRSVPFDNRMFGDADITPQKVKGALFSMIGEWLHGRGFLDLFAGSGQMGFEALSRGADPVVMNDSDRRRCDFMRKCISELGISPVPAVLNLDAALAIGQLHDRGYRFDFIFIDPPYRKEKGPAEQYREIMERITGEDLLTAGGIVIVQHYYGNVMDESAGALRFRSTRTYGTSALSVYEQPG